MPSIIVSVEWTDANTDRAVGILVDPEFETFLRIDGPFCYADQIGTIVCFSARWFKGYSRRRTTLGTSVADLTECLDS